jgi:putative acetyltransferase
VVTFRPFQSGDETAFRELKQAWIGRYFSIEPKDEEMLRDPAEQILQPGGQIVMATLADRAIGCCAILPMADGGFEIAKNGRGRRLLGTGRRKKTAGPCCRPRPAAGRAPTLLYGDVALAAV